MKSTSTNKKPGLELKQLSDVGKILVRQPAQVPDAEVDLNLIDTLPQVRKKFTELEELARSIIFLKGIQHPLLVHAEDNGRYRLIAGERRLRAAPIAGLSKVPVIIKRGLDESEISALQVSENRDSVQLTAYEEALGVIEHVEKFGTKKAMLIWNHNDGWISKRVSVQRYAEPVLELLKTNLCTDFEVLHCLNQMCEIEPTLTEFYRMRHRLSEGGPPLSRDEARNLVARMKDFQKQQRYLSRRVKESGDAGSKGKVTKDRVPPALPLTSKGKASGAGDAKPLQKADSESTPSIQQDASNSVGELLSAVFARGETNLSTFQEIKDRLAQAGSDMTETEWVLWQSFLSMALPMLEGIGSERAVYFLKKLSRELSGKQSPIEYWERLHPLDGSDSRVPFIAKPKGWHV